MPTECVPRWNNWKKTFTLSATRVTLAINWNTQMRFWTCQQGDILSESARSSAMCCLYLHIWRRLITWVIRFNKNCRRIISFCASWPWNLIFVLMSLSAHFDWNSVEISWPLDEATYLHNCTSTCVKSGRRWVVTWKMSRPRRRVKTFRWCH